MTTEFDTRKLETSLYRTMRKCEMCFDILNRTGMAHKCVGQTDAPKVDDNED